MECIALTMPVSVNSWELIDIAKSRKMSIPVLFIK
jgi:hypothetical protein